MGRKEVMSWNAIGSAVSRASSASGAALARAALHLSNRCRLPRRDPAGYRCSARRSRCVRGPAAGRTGRRHPRCRHRLPRRRDPLPAVVRTSAPAAAPAAAETGGEDRQLYTVSKPPAALPSSASAKKESTRRCLKIDGSWFKRHQVQYDRRGWRPRQPGSIMDVFVAITGEYAPEKRVFARNSSNASISLHGPSRGPAPTAAQASRC